MLLQKDGEGEDCLELSDPGSGAVVKAVKPKDSIGHTFEPVRGTEPAGSPLGRPAALHDVHNIVAGLVPASATADKLRPNRRLEISCLSHRLP